jgi:DNA-binding beta-propeller fold protein YncE
LNRALVVLSVVLSFPLLARSNGIKSLTLVQTIEMPDVPVGPLTDHLAVDLKGHRLFTTPQARHSLYVFDLRTGKLIYDVRGIENPHAVLYRSDIDQIYVTDGGAGLLKIFSGRDYHLIKSVKLLLNADSIGYDPATKYLYVVNGGEDAKLPYSQLSVVDTSTGDRVGDIRLPVKELEAMALESSSAKLYINFTDKNQIGVVDRRTRTLLSTWAITKAKKNAAIALDEEHHLLFVGCRSTDVSGFIVVVDTNSGEELETLPIGGHVDYMAYDPQTRRIFASCGKPGSVYVYREHDPHHYDLVAKATSALMGKTGLWVPELNRFFVSIPHQGNTPAEILVFQVP